VRQRTDEANATGTLVPASSGAKAPLACEGRRLVGCVRASNRLQKSANDAEVQRSAPVATGRVDGDPSSLVFAGNCVTPGGSKGVDKRCRGGKAMAPGRPEPDVRKGIAGRRSSQDGRHSRSFFGSFVHAGGLKAALAALTSHVHARASRGEWERRQGCQRQGMHAWRREDNARRGEMSRSRTGGGASVAARRSESHCRTTVDVLHFAGAQAFDAGRTNDARVLVRRSEMAEVGPTHRALRRPVSRKASRRRDAGQGALRTTY
jgi:hypothetical protein